jgi:hypothetical protein
MFDRQELAFLYELLDAVNPKGLQAKMLLVRVMAKVARALENENGKESTADVADQKQP